MFDAQQLAVVPRDHLANFVLMHCRAQVAWRESASRRPRVSKRVDAAQLLQLALVQDRDPVAHVLHVGQQVAAHDDRLALVA